MGFTQNTCEEFVEVLASKAPVPGGGGASALVGAVGMALGGTSHAVGTSKAVEISARAGAISSVAIVTSGIVTVIISLFL